MTLQLRRRAGLTLLGLCAAFVVPYAAYASGNYHRAGPQLPKYQQECGACHTAYPAGMLPAASWQRLMDNLKTHFGTDATLDPATQKELAAWLNENAGTNKRMSGEPQEDRITRATWFTLEHNKIPAATWKLPAVKSASNCGACHNASNQGNFNERDVKIPR